MIDTRFDVAGKVVCITGGSRGLGKALANAFAQAGARVMAASWEPEALAEDEAEAKRAGLSIRTHVTDVTVRDQCRALIDATVSAYGGIDVMICNAGIDIIKPAETFEEAEWDQILDVNLRGYFYCAQFAAIPMLARSGGAIIMTSSIAGVHGITGLAPYAASKGGVDQLVRTLAVEWATRGVRVNAVAPGYLQNIMTGIPYDPDNPYQKHAVERTPMRRRGGLQELTGAYLFLASEAASYVTGSILYVDGGYHAG